MARARGSSPQPGCRRPAQRGSSSSWRSSSGGAAAGPASHGAPAAPEALSSRCGLYLPRGSAPHCSRRRQPFPVTGSSHLRTSAELMRVPSTAPSQQRMHADVSTTASCAGMLLLCSAVVRQTPSASATPEALLQVSQEHMHTSSNPDASHHTAVHMHAAQASHTRPALAAGSTRAIGLRCGLGRMHAEYARRHSLFQQPYHLLPLRYLSW